MLKACLRGVLFSARLGFISITSNLYQWQEIPYGENPDDRKWEQGL